ncbi:MAG: phosphatidate cytidylyltransferase [Pseudomonadota bacterium]
MRTKLKQRIVTGLLLAGSVIAAVTLLPLPALALLFGLVVVVGTHEWSSLAGFSSLPLRFGYSAFAIAAMSGLYVYCEFGSTPPVQKLQPLFGVACLWWSIALLWIKAYPASGPLWAGRPMLGLMGLLVLLPPWLASLFLLSYEQGKLMLLAMVVLVAVADIGAYFSGRRFGRTKLAPRVSPGKSWEGVVGGLCACTVLAIAAHTLLGLERPSLQAVIAIALFGASASVVGDLLESMVKRHRGVKDSGTILPGHGGILDRIDGITAAGPVVALGVILAGWSP